MAGLARISLSFPTASPPSYCGVHAQRSSARASRAVSVAGDAVGVAVAPWSAAASLPCAALQSFSARRRSLLWQPASRQRELRTAAGSTPARFSRLGARVLRCLGGGVRTVWAAVMSAASLAAVNTLSAKAFELAGKGHYARAIEKQRAAVAAAQALGNTPDCLITAMLHIYGVQYVNGSVPVRIRLSPHLYCGDADTYGIRRATQILYDVIAMLNRRLLAGTLMPGTCRAMEVEWNAVRLRATTKSLSAAELSLYLSQAAPFVGYEAYITTATVAATVCTTYANVVSELTKDNNVKQLLGLMKRAIELFAQQRDNFPLRIESALVMVMYHFDEAGLLDAYPEKQLLLDTWKAVQKSGVLHKRKLEDKYQGDALVQVARQEAALAAETRLTCALQSGGAREAHAAHFKRCAACKTVVYCCREHQVEHWPAHKAACKAARKPVAAQAAASSSP